MNHGDHSGHHKMPMDDMPMSTCSMNMLWNSQVKDVCVVFESWHIHGPWGMLLSCLAITLISVLYAHLLHNMKNRDKYLAYQLAASSSSPVPSASGGAETSAHGRLIPPLQAVYGGAEGGNGNSASTRSLGPTRVPLRYRVPRAGMYALTVALSFWLMLVAMTYNTYLFGSIVLGSFIGHLMYEAEIDVGLLAGGQKGLACH